MTGSLTEAWREYEGLIRFWREQGDAAPQGEADRATERQLELVEQMAATEATTLGEVAIQARVLADMLSLDPLDPERALAAVIAKRLTAMAAAN